MATRMLQRRGTAAEWAAANPILASGEIGFETDTKLMKMGDGVTAWNSLTLPYMMTGGATMTGALSLIAPTAPAHAARKQDVDNLAANLSPHIATAQASIGMTTNLNTGTSNPVTVPFNNIRTQVGGWTLSNNELTIPKDGYLIGTMHISATSASSTGTNTRRLVNINVNGVTVSKFEWGMIHDSPYISFPFQTPVLQGQKISITAYALGSSFVISAGSSGGSYYDVAVL